MRRGTLIWGAALILFGVLLLLSNAGVIDVDIWGLIWPLFLLAAGIWFVWSVLAGPERAGEAEEAAIPLEGARRARLRIHHGAGRLQIDSSASRGNVASGAFAGGLDYHSRLSGDELEVEMRPRSRALVPIALPVLWFSSGGLEWQLGLTPDVPLKLDLRTGAGEALLDLTDLKVEELRIQTGASSASVRLPARAGLTRVNVSGGMTSLRLQVPEGVAARIRASAGLGSISVDRRRFPRTGGVYQSPDYETAQNKVEIRADTGLGSLVVG